MNKAVEKKIKNIVSKEDGFIFNNNYKLLDITDDYCVFQGTITENSLNPYNIAHGGYIFGLADTCAGVLASVDGKEAVTTSGSIIYLKKVTGKIIIAKAIFLKKGKNISNIEVEVKDENGILVSKVIFEYFYV